MAGAYYAFIAGFPDFSLEEGKLAVSVAEARTEALSVCTPEDARFLLLFF